MKYIKTMTLTAIAMSAAACSPAGAAGDLNRGDIEKIVKEYLLENPEVVRDALIALNAKEESEALEAVHDNIFKDKRDVVIGPDDAKVTIVEFFDYNCGFCKRSTDWLQQTMEKHPKDVRVIFKELPILKAASSRTAAKAALAAGRQGKYESMHFELMAQRSLSTDSINAIAKEIGLDMDLFDKDMADPTISIHIEDNIDTARQIPMFGGTPFFMINGGHISGADTVGLQELLDEALAG
ncbi:MAG: DsbA family protein [Alphaproteobacteria bacterium]